MNDNCIGDDAFKAVRWHLGHYWEIKQAVSMQRVEMRRHVSSNIGGIQDSRLSDPTAAAALSNLTKIRVVKLPGFGLVYRPEDWIDAIDKGLAACSNEVREAAKENFWHHKSSRYIYTTMNMDKDTFYKRREKAVATVAIAAAQYGLIDITGGNK